MPSEVHLDHQFILELRRDTELAAPALHAEAVTDDIADLIEEAYIGGILGDRLPADAEVISATVRPRWATEPLVNSLDICLNAGPDSTYVQSFRTGRWARKAQRAAQRLRDEGAIAQGEPVFQALVALANGRAPAPPAPLFQPPIIAAQSLADFGVRERGAGALVPDRPVLVNARMVEDILRATAAAGPSETGGAVLGKLLRLPQPLPGTTTCIVTVLAAGLEDARHVGTPGNFQFSPEALAEAAQIAGMRGKGECVLTAWHSHGWGTTCGNCNQSDQCALPECSAVSLADYQVMESLFPSKVAVMPIAGRRLGAAGRRPVLEIHAWQGGALRPCRWQAYSD